MIFNKISDCNLQGKDEPSLFFKICSKYKPMKFIGLFWLREKHLKKYICELKKVHMIC